MSDGRASSDHGMAETAAERLAWYFYRNGYVRLQNAGRTTEADGWNTRKSGEVRLVASSTEELDEIRRLLEEAGFKAGKPWRKRAQYRQPVYGREQVARFLLMLQQVER